MSVAENGVRAPKWRRAVVSVPVLALLGLSAAAGIAPAGATATTGTALTIGAGDGTYSALIPGPAIASPIYYPASLTADGKGNVYVSFSSGSDDYYSIATINRAGAISYLLNSGENFGAPSPGSATASAFGGVAGIAADAAGNVYVGDEDNNLVAKINTSGQLSIIAGNGTASSGPLSTGTATTVSITPDALAAGPDGSVYIFDSTAEQVAKVTAAGQLSIVAGVGTSGTPTPGTASSPIAATASPFTSAIGGLAVDSSGNLFISDRSAHCVTMVSAGSGFLTSVVGACGRSGVSVPGLASASGLKQPRQVAIDRHDDLYIVDRGNKYIEKVVSPASGTGVLSRLAGNGSSGSLSAGPAATSPVSVISGLTVDRSLNVYLAEDYGTRIGKIASVPSVPDAPTALAVTPGPGSLMLSFSAPGDDGGSVITSYEYSTDGATWSPLSIVGDGPITATVSGLSSETTYPVTVRAVNGAGAGSSSGTVTATPLLPGSAPAPLPLSSTGVARAAQHGTVVVSAGDTVTLLDGGLPVTTVSVPDVGIYTFDPATNVITFAPAIGYSGTPAGVQFQITDLATRTGSAVYTPTVTKPAPPALAARTSTGTGVQSTIIEMAEGGAVQLLNAVGDPDTAVTLAEGTYVLDPVTGIITFIPASDFIGTAPAVSFQVSDAYGQTGDTTYTATVTADPAVIPVPDPDPADPDPAPAPDPTPVEIPVVAPTPDPIATTTPAPTPSLSPAQPLPTIEPSAVTKVAAGTKPISGTTQESTASSDAYTELDAYPINAQSSLPTAEACCPRSDGLQSWWFAWCVLVCVGALALGRSLHRRW